MTHDSRIGSLPQVHVAVGPTRTLLSHILAPSRTLFGSRAWVYAVTCLSVGLLIIGCSSKVKTEKTVELEDPHVANGVIVDDDAAAKIEKMGDAVDAMKLAEAAKASDPNVTASGDGAPAKISVAEAVAMTNTQSLPAQSTTLTPLPKLSPTEINEICEHLALHLESTLGYNPASSAVADALPALPEGIIGDRIVARMAEDGTHVLRFGYRHFVTQPPQFWTLGVVVGHDGKLAANPDLAQVGPKVGEIIKSLNEMRAGLTVRDLEAKLIQLSYVDTKAALSMLKGMGVSTMNKPEEIPPKIDFDKLPFVVGVEDPDSKFTGLVGSKDTGGGGSLKLSMTPGVASTLESNAIASPMTQLLVLFHPAHPGQFSEVRDMLDKYIDRPARQIFIEAMVLEISEEGLRDLGVEWEMNEGPLSVTGGALNADTSKETLNIGTIVSSPLNEVFDGNYDWNWSLAIRALVRSGKAEILSRPSVLTLNNRQATIRVGQDIPIASSLQGSYGGKVSFAFNYLPTGILLNIRPRINETGSEVSMLVDTVVSAEVPGEELRLTDNGVVLAEAPTVSARRVQTYARIANNTPLIIGGLVSKENIVTRDKIPLLGDLPLVGMAFRGEKKEKSKREVIIVLTPNVLPTKEELRRSLPKDEDKFDNFGNELFRDSYRIRGEDVFDLTFLLENKRIASYRTKAREVAAQNFRLGLVEPFRSFVRDNIPGESILVTRMIYEVIKRLDLASEIEASRIIYFEGQQVGGYNVEFLQNLLDKVGGKGLKKLDGKALAITYQYDRESLEEGRLGTEPIPKITLVDCPDRDTWSTLLWELNQPTEDGRQRHTILIQNEGDVLRLRRALALKRIATLNGGEEQMRLRNFSVGKVLLMPQLKKGQIHVMDADTARYFFHTEHYYAATLAEIEKQLKALDQKLHEPEISILLDAGAAKDSPDGGSQ